MAVESTESIFRRGYRSVITKLGELLDIRSDQLPNPVDSSPTTEKWVNYQQNVASLVVRTRGSLGGSGWTKSPASVDADLAP